MGFAEWLRSHPRLWTWSRVLRGWPVISVEYPLKPVPRWGHGKPPHPQLSELLEKRREDYRATLQGFLGLRGALERIPLREEPGSNDPCWINEWLPGLDTVGIYGMLAARKPARFVEVGSGYSTRVARRAIRDQGLATRVTSIDPQPRAGIDALCDEVVRKPLEDTDLRVFDALRSGDVCFIDNSHYAFQNSDVTVTFTEVLPRLAPGVLVHVHDIHLPFDYPPDWTIRHYNEQYLLAAMLLAGGSRYEVLLPNAFVSADADLAGALRPLWDALPGVPRHGTSFWMAVR